jgi:hypothetical protein
MSRWRRPTPSVPSVLADFWRLPAPDRDRVLQSLERDPRLWDAPHQVVPSRVLELLSGVAGDTLDAMRQTLLLLADQAGKLRRVTRKPSEAERDARIWHRRAVEGRPRAEIAREEDMEVEAVAKVLLRQARQRRLRRPRGRPRKMDK